jgi:hypothetical protein
MAGEKELEEQMYALVMTMEGLTQRIGELQVDMISLRQEVAGLAAETNTLSQIMEEEQQRRAKP